MPLVSGRYAVKNPHWLTNGQPSGVLRESLPQGRFQALNNMSALTTQVMLSVALPLQAGDLITNLTFVSGGTAAGTPTNWWFALYDTSATPALIQQTADQTTTAWAANTAITLPLAAAYLVPAPGVYYAAVMVKATTPPTLAGLSLENAAAAGALVTGQKILAQTSGSSLTATAPSTITSATTVANLAYAVAS
jgi:hypothetical protein